MLLIQLKKMLLSDLKKIRTENPDAWILSLINMINKTPADSKAILTEIVLPNDTNNLRQFNGRKTPILDGYHC